MKNGGYKVEQVMRTEKIQKPDPNGNRRQRRAAKKIVSKATK